MGIQHGVPEEDANIGESWRKARPALQTEEQQDEGEVYFARLHLFKIIIPDMEPIKYT